MPIKTKRAYEQPDKSDGYRVLVDRLWPRGISKDEAKLDDWMKDIAPSNELRKWYHSNPSEWEEFRKRYLAELKDHRNELRPLAVKAGAGTVTLVFSSKETDQNNATVLKQYLQMI